MNKLKAVKAVGKEFVSCREEQSISDNRLYINLRVSAARIATT